MFMVTKCYTERNYADAFFHLSVRISESTTKIPSSRYVTSVPFLYSREEKGIIQTVGYGLEDRGIVVRLPVIGANSGAH